MTCKGKWAGKYKIHLTAPLLRQVYLVRGQGKVCGDGTPYSVRLAIGKDARVRRKNAGTLYIIL
jgi:hypothetical protein